jgi:hypothetical protein
MGMDDDADCPAHDWVLDEMHLADEGATLHYTCSRCPALLVRGPGEAFPELGQL